MTYRCRRKHDHAEEYPVYASVKNRMAILFHCKELEDVCHRMKRNKGRRNPGRFPWLLMRIQEMQRYREDLHYPLLSPCPWCFLSERSVL